MLAVVARQAVRLKPRPTAVRVLATAVPHEGAAFPSVELQVELPPIPELITDAIDSLGAAVNQAFQSEPERAIDFTSELYYSKTRLPLNEATTLHPVAYTSEEFLQTEKKRVIEGSWTCVGTLGQVSQPGEVLTCQVGTQPIIVTRNKKGQLNAFKNVCRHRGHKICVKDGRYPTLMCPYHRWAYNHDGKLVATPLFKGDEGSDIQSSFDTSHMKKFDKSQFSLFPVRMGTLGHMVFVNVDGNAPPLHEYLGDLPSALAEYLPSLSCVESVVRYRHERYAINANWKLLAENFMEYYHLPSVHPSLVQISGMNDHKRLQGPGCYVGFVTEPLTRAGTPADPDILPHFPGISDAAKQRAVFHHVFPNVFYFLFPHSIYTVISHPHPTDPAKSYEVVDMYVPRDGVEGNEEKLEALWAFMEMTNKEDIDACEAVQEGLAVYEYQGGRMSFKFEETIHRFQNMVVDHMTGHARVPPGDDTAPPGEARFVTPPPQ